MKRYEGGSNNMWLLGDPGNRRLLKKSDLGYPHTEEAVAHIFDLAGVPHVPVTRVKNDFVSYPFLEWAHNLNTISPYEIHQFAPQIFNGDQNAKTHLAEWLADVSDRHGGNYLFHPQHGILSIDHELAFHPDQVKTKNPRRPSMRLDVYPLGNDNLRYWSGSPFTSALANFGITWHPQGDKAHMNHVIPRDTIERILHHQEEIINAVEHGVQHVEPVERQFARHAMRLRLNTLRNHYLHGSPITLENLKGIHHQLRNHIDTHRAEVQQNALKEPLHGNSARFSGSSH